MSRSLLILLIAVLALPAVAAQTPSTSVTIAGLPTQPVEANRTLAVPVDVTFTVGGLVCLTPGVQEFPVTLTATASNSSATVNPGNLVFVVPPGTSLGNDYSQTLTATVLVEPQDTPTNTVTVEAAFAGGNAGCTGAGNAPAASDEGTFTLTFTEQAIPPEPSESMPGIAPVVLLGALAVLAAVVRRN